MMKNFQGLLADIRPIFIIQSSSGYPGLFMSTRHHRLDQSCFRLVYSSLISSRFCATFPIRRYLLHQMTHEQLHCAVPRSLDSSWLPFMPLKSSPFVHNYMFLQFESHTLVWPQKMKECTVLGGNTKKWVSIAPYQHDAWGSDRVPVCIRIMLHCCTSREMNCEGKECIKHT